MQRMYFGRPINIFGSQLDIFLFQKIRAAFPSHEFEDPNQPHHQRGYKLWSERTGNGMDYYFVEVLPNCAAGIFLPFRDNWWGIGVWREAAWFDQHDRPVYKITPTGIISEAYLKQAMVLTVEETRDRIRTSSGDRIPY